MDDLALIQDFARTRSEDAFRTLVDRHSGMVAGVATRVAGPAAADEITQAVFIILARKADSIREGTILAAWLYRTARYVALEFIRADQRRRHRHEIFSAMQNQSDDATLWKQVAPLVDAAVERLGEAERNAVILRFFEGRTFAEVATAVGISEAAAKMRVSRALEKLRAILAREGLTISAGALALTLTTNAAPAAHTGAATIAAAAVAHSPDAPLGILVKGGLKAMAASKTKTTAFAVLALMALSVGVYEVARPRPVVGTFHPMAGEWVGKLESTGDDIPSGPPQQTSLSITTSEDGRTCNIEMRVGEPQNEQRFRFTHSVDATGRTITTTDDPLIGLLNGPGEVTVSSTNGAAQWRAGFRAKNRAGRSECEWSVNGSELKIRRHDRLAMSVFNKVDRYSLVDLRRKQD